MLNQKTNGNSFVAIRLFTATCFQKKFSAELTSVLRGLIVVIVLLFGLESNAQRSVPEKLFKEIEKHPQEDSDRLYLLIKYVNSQCPVNPFAAKESANQAVALARKIGDERGLALALDATASLYLFTVNSIDFNSAIEEAISIDRRLGLKEELAWALYHKDLKSIVYDNQFDTTQFDQNEALLTFQALNNKEGIGMVMANQGLAFIQTNEKKALEFFNYSQTLLSDKEYEASLAFTLGFVFFAYYANSEPDKAIEVGTKLLEICRRRQFDVIAAGASGLLGNIYRESAQYSLSMEYFLEALKITEAQKDTTKSLTIFLNLGGIQKSIGNLEQAQYHFSKSTELAKKINNYYLLSYAMNASAEVFAENKDYVQALNLYEQILKICPLVASYLGNNNSCQCFVNQYSSIASVKNLMNDTEGALLYYQASLDSAMVFDMKYEMASNLNHISNVILVASDSSLMKSGIDPGKRYETVRDNCLKSLEIANANDWLELKANSLKCLITASEKLNDPSSALHFSMDLMDVKDSILTNIKYRAISDLQIKFETEKKEQQIQLLEKDNERQKLMRNGFVAGFSLVALFALVFLIQRNRISKERKRSDELLLNILPTDVADELKLAGTSSAKEFDQVTILFTDFKGFTSIAETLTPTELVHELNVCFVAFDHIITSKGIEKIKTIGDAYMAAGGLPDPNTSSPESVVEAAIEMQNFMIQRSIENRSMGKPYFEMRVGIHTGSVVAGIVGIKKFAYDIWGDAVNTASRMESSGEIGRVNISESTYSLVKDSPKFTFVSRGRIEAKGKGAIEMYFVS